jgi:hypothetical protein
MIRRGDGRRKVAQPLRKKQAEAIQHTLAELDRLEAQSPKIKPAVDLFRRWLNDESGYDEETLPKLKAALDRERTRVGARRLFDA